MKSELMINVPPRSKAVEDSLTHFLVIHIGDDDFAIGEAAEVHQITENRWYAHVGKWLIRFEDKENVIYQNVFAEVKWRTIRGPDFKLVPKKGFSGKFFGDL